MSIKGPVWPEFLVQVESTTKDGFVRTARSLSYIVGRNVRPAKGPWFIRAVITLSAGEMPARRIAQEP
jgi:hypothetical protein